MKNSIYLDYAAATPMDERVAKAMTPFFSDNFYNPSATYLKAGEARQSLQAARQTVAGNLGARLGEVIFTAGATEANNLAIQGVMSQYPDGEMLLSAIEHDSVAEPAKLYNHKIVPVNRRGLIELDELRAAITNKTVLVSVMLVNNELGTIQPLADISRLLNSIGRQRQTGGNSLPLLLHTDAAQAGNYINLQSSRLGVDLMSINGGKLYGPKQSGALMVKAGTKLKPQIVGGGQEFGLRSGTENVAAAAGLAEALSLAQSLRTNETVRLAKLRKDFIGGLTKNLPRASLNGSLSHSAPHIVNIRFDGLDNERLMMELDEQGIMCAVGSACSASSSEPSHVLSAIGLSKPEAQSSLRFSFGRQTTAQDIDRSLKFINKLAV